MPDNNFNELLIHTLKQIHTRLDRLEAKVDEKAGKGNAKTLEQRLDRIIDRLAGIERDIRTLTWMSSLGFVCLGILLVLLKPF